MKNADKLPPETIPVLEEHIGVLVRALGTNLVGVYVHGSAAMGGFGPQQSDLDYLAVVSSALSARERQSLSHAFLALHATSGFRKGVEMSIVEERFAGKDFRYPTPYEFHMGSLEQLAHHGKPHMTEHADADLASFFTVTRERGVCVYGKEIAKVFAAIDRKYFLASNYEDVRNARETILNNPVYVILNLCRTLCTLKDGGVYSKIDGARRFLSQSNPHRALVERALLDYEGATTSGYEREESVLFAQTMLAEIEAQLRK
jgi:streptomycin 3"-adenylyltransferase